MYGGLKKMLGQKINVKFFTVDPYVGGGRTPTALFKICQLLEKYFFENQNVKNKI